MLRSILFIVVTVTSTVIGAIPVIILGIFDPFTKLSRQIARLWSRLLLWVAGVRVHISGLEHVAPNRSYVIVANHQSHMDIPVIFANLPLLMTVISKKELFKIPFFGWAMSASGILKVDRSNRQQAIATLRQAETVIKERKLSLLAFPEGTRSPDGKIHPFKKGPFILAINAGLPILPISIYGTFRILPKKSIFVKPGTVRVKIHPPVSTKGLSIEQRDELIRQIHEIIKTGFHHESALVS